MNEMKKFNLFVWNKKYKHWIRLIFFVPILVDKIYVLLIDKKTYVGIIVDSNF